MSQTTVKSIYGLSKKAGVSPATVSKALNNSPEISASVTREIKQLAKKYNFTPRVTRKRVANICVLIQQYSNMPLDFDPFVSNVLEGVAMFTHDENAEMSIYARDVDSLNKSNLVRELRVRGVDGVILSRTTKTSDYVQQFIDQDFPFFVMDGDCPQMPDRTINLTPEKASREAASRLIELGHKNVGVLDVSVGSPGARRPLDGFQQAYEDVGIGILSDNIYANRNSLPGIEFGRVGVKELLKQSPEITAVFVLDHAGSIGAIKGLAELSLSVPKDVSIIGTGEYLETGYLSPSLSTIALPYKELGMYSAQQVHRLIRGLDVMPKDRAPLDGHVIWRGSTGPVREKEFLDIL